MRRKKHNNKLSPKEILSILSSPSHSLTHAQTDQCSSTAVPPQVISIFDIPLIFNMICSTLSKEDIWSCMRVNKSWHALARLQHWRSFYCVFYRHWFYSIFSNRVSSTEKSYHTLAAKINLLSENQPLIRSLTLDMSSVDLLAVPFCNLVYLHVFCSDMFGTIAAEKQPPMAIDLLCRNYLLQELKITRAWLLLQHFNSGALQFLRSSCLRSLDIEGLKYTRHAITQSIIGHCPDTLQELRLVFSDSTRLYDEDAEHSPEDVTIVPRVHPSLRALTLKFPRIDRQLEIVLCDLIQSSPNLQEFTFYSLTQPLSKIITCLAKNCPVLNSVDFTATPIPEADMHCFIALCPPLYSLGMTFQSDHHRGVIPSLISRFGHTLQELRIHGSDLPPNSDHGFIVSVLAHCPCLKTLSIDSDHLATNKGVALQDLLAVEWATTSLEDLCLAISIPKDDAEIYRLLQEWKHHQGIYLYPGEYDPEGPIGRCRTYVNQFLQFFKNLQAQPRLTSLKLKWGQGGCLIPCEFAEVFTGGELTVEKLSRIMLNLSSLKAVSKVFRSRERKAEEYKREQEIYDKLSSCNIVVENVETPREMGGDNGRAAEKSSWQPDSNSYDDHEYSLYKSRKARKMHYKEK